MNEIIENKETFNNQVVNDDGNITEAVKKSLKKFFDSPINMFEVGNDEDRPRHFQDRPGVKAIASQGKGDKIYFQSTEEEKEIKVTKNTPENGAILDTKSHRMFEKMENRFRNIRDNMTLFIIDPDVLRARYAMDTSENRSMGKTILMYLKEKMSKTAPDATRLIDKDTVAGVIKTAMDGDSPHASPKLRNVTDENLQGEGLVNIVVGVNPETVDTEWFSKVPGHEERMERDGLKQEHFQRLALYHELGHATDTDLVTRGKKWHTLTSLDRYHSSHRTECIADAHAVLQMARDEGNTKMGELWGDFRIDRFAGTIKKMDDLRTGKISPEFEKQLDAAHRENLKPQKGETKEEAIFRELDKTNELKGTIQKYGPGLAYHTAPTIDVAVEFAKKGLKDGSLLKMTDEQVLKASREIVNQTACTKAQVASYLLDAATGKKNPIIEEAKLRSEKARDNMTLPRKEIDKKHDKKYKEFVDERIAKIRKIVGLPPEKPKATEQERLEAKRAFIKTKRAIKAMKKEFNQWSSDFIESFSKTDMSRPELLKMVAKEKDAVREVGKKDPIAKMKLNFMNLVLEKPEQAIEYAVAKKTVNQEIRKITPQTEQFEGTKAVGSFISASLKVIEAMEKNVEKSKTRSSANTIDEQMKTLNAQKKSYTKVLQAERNAQAEAFNVRQNPDAWKLAQTNPDLKRLVTEKAKQKHPSWIDSCHLNLVANNKQSNMVIGSAIKESRSEILMYALNEKDIKNAFIEADGKGANKLLKERAKKIEELKKTLAGKNKKPTAAKDTVLAQRMAKQGR